MLDGNIIINTLQWIGDKWTEYLSPYVIIRDYEAGVILRLGKYKHKLKKGLNWKLPLIDEVHTCNCKADTYRITGNDVTTSDGITMTIGIAIEYTIEDEYKWLIQNNDSLTNLHDIAWGIAGEFLVLKNWDEYKQKTTRTELKNKIKTATEHLGVNIETVYFGNIVKSRVFTIYKPL